jgi:hypothetical protein
MGGHRFALITTVLGLAVLAAIELGLYRPWRARLKAAESSLKSVQAQLAGVARRKQGDAEVLRALGVGEDGRGIREQFGEESGVEYLNALIDRCRMSRVDFRTEAAEADGPFVKESFFVSLRGPFSRALELMRTAEASARLTRIEEFRMEPENGTTLVLLRLRLTVYSLREERP